MSVAAEYRAVELTDGSFGIEVRYRHDGEDWRDWKLMEWDYLKFSDADGAIACADRFGAINLFPKTKRVL